MQTATYHTVEVEIVQTLIDYALIRCRGLSFVVPVAELVMPCLALVKYKAA